MRSQEDIQNAISAFLRALRTENDLSKSKMAETLDIDRHTWIRWESGVSSPTIADLVNFYDHFGSSVVRHLLDILMPDSDASHGVPVEQLRKNAADYYLASATDHQVNVWSYMMHELHGSEITAQIEEFCAVDHLPMQYRYFIAEQIYVYYMMALNRGELINTDRAMPDMDAFVRGLKHGQKAAFDKLQGYKK